MMNEQNEMRQHVDLIDEALCAAGLDNAWSLVEKLRGGLSTSTLYHIVAGDHHYAIRITVPDDGHNDLPREHTVMQTINALGIAPHLHYANVDSGIAIADFIVGPPLLPWTDERKPFLPMLAATVRKLHDGPSLPIGSSIFDKAKAAVALLPPVFQATSLVVNATALFTPLEPFLRDPNHLRPMHGDLNPGNMLFDGTTLWFIDWTEAQQDNRYFDLACCSNFFFHRSEELQAAFLHAYFDRPPTPVELYAYRQMLVFCALYYGLVFLYLSSIQGTPLPAPQEIATLPEYAILMERFGTGAEQVSNPPSQQRLGFAYLQRAMNLWSDLRV